MAKQNKSVPKWVTENIPVEVADSQLFKFTIAIGSGDNKQDVDVDLLSDLGIDYELLQSQMEDIPSQYVFYGSIYSELKLQLAKLERQIKGKRGQITDRTTKEAAAKAVKLTEKQLAAIIESDLELQEIELKAAIFQRNVGKLWFTIEALKMKADNLRSLSGFSKIDYQQAQQGGTFN